MAERQRRDKGTGSFWQADNGQWWAKATRDGRTLRARATSRADARQKAKALAAELAEHADIDTARMTMQAWLTEWLERVKARVKPKTLAFYRRHCEYMVPHIGKIQLGRLEPRHVQAMLTALGKEQLKPRSVAHVRDVLRNSLNRAIKDKAIRDNAATLADAPIVDDYEAYPLSPAEQERLLAAVEGVRRLEPYGTRWGTRVRLVEDVAPHRLAAAAHLALGLGLRRGEFLALTWRDVDWEDRMLTVRTSKTDAGRGRRLPLTDALIVVLRAHLKAQAEEAEAIRAAAVAMGEPAPLWNAKGLIFCSEEGTPLSESNFTARVFKTWLRWAELPASIRVHDLRHTFVTTAIGAGGDPKSVQALAGHADAGITMGIYAHAQSDLLRPVVEAAERARKRG